MLWFVVDSSRVRLTMKGAAEGTDYINANYLDVSKFNSVGQVYVTALYSESSIFALSNISTVDNVFLSNLFQDVTKSFVIW